MSRITRVKPWVDPTDPAAKASAAQELARREAAAAAAAEALMNVRTTFKVVLWRPCSLLLPCRKSLRHSKIPS